MKYLLAMAFLMMGFKALSAECNTYEAQVFGTIKSVKKIQDVCFYKVSIESINEHALCPLTKYEIEEGSIQYEAGYHDDCLYRFGGEFSSIVVKDRNDVISFD